MQVWCICYGHHGTNQRHDKTEGGSSRRRSVVEQESASIGSHNFDNYHSTGLFFFYGYGTLALLSI